MEVSPGPSSSGFRAQNSYVPPPVPASAPSPSASASTPAPAGPVQYGPVQAHLPAHEPARDAAAAPPLPLPPTPAARDSTRTRHSSACFPCAKRKVKCDRDVKNPCSNCLRRSQPEQCQVKSQKEKLSHSRSDPALRDGEVHRDKRPRYEAYQSSFHATPAVKNDLSPASNGEPSLLPSMANYAANSPDERALPFSKRSPPPGSARKSKDLSHWDSIEVLLPPRKDFIKYINTFRIGAHVINPVIHDLDAFESQVCTFLEDIGTPRIKQRLAGKDRRASEVELGRLARLLAVLASGSRYEDSDCATQVAVSRDYVRRAFQCLRLGNFMMRPTVECIQTLILLVSELQNDHQPHAAWAMLSTTSRLAHSIGVSFGEMAASPPDYDSAIARSALAWQDMMHSIWHQDPLASTAQGYSSLGVHSDDRIPSFLNALCDAHRSAVVCLGLPLNSTPPSSELLRHVDFIRATCRSYALRECKSMRDRIEIAGFKLHGFFLLSSVLLRIGESMGKHYPAEAVEFDEQARSALLEVIQTFTEFSITSSLPVRTYIMVHYALTSALELCRWPHAPDGNFQSMLLPRLLKSLDAMTGHMTNGTHVTTPKAVSLLPRPQLRAHDLLERIYADSRQVYNERHKEREIAENLRAEAGQLLQELNQLREPIDENDGTTMPLQATWGL